MTDTRDEGATAGALPPLGKVPPKSRAIPREVELKYLVRDLEALRAWLARDWGGALDGVESGLGAAPCPFDVFRDAPLDVLRRHFSRRTESR